MKAYDLAVIGSGPGGYVAAIRAAQLGMQVALIEEAEIGGVCLNWGCIPTKAILTAAERYEELREGWIPGVQVQDLSHDYDAVIGASRKAAERLTRGVRSLMRKNRIEVLQGRGRLSDGGTVTVSSEAGQTAVEARHTLLATGSTEFVFPGVEVDGKRVLTSREALESRTLPDSIAVVGGGAVGLEFAYTYVAYGVQVTLIEMQDQLVPGLDREVAEALASSFTRRGVKLALGTTFRGVESDGEGVLVSVEGEKGEAELRVDQMLLAVGRRALVDDLGLEQAGVEVERGFIATRADYRTSAEGVWAIGDVIGPPLLAHKASEEGKAAVEFMAGVRKQPVDLNRVPACIYCQPQIASIGLSEEQARAQGHDVRVGKVPFAANGKAVGSGHTEGFVKLVSEARYGEILGAQAIGAGVTELIAEIGLAMTLESTVHEVCATSHAHPTLSEVTMEAALAADGAAIHF